MASGENDRVRSSRTAPAKLRRSHRLAAAALASLAVAPWCVRTASAGELDWDPLLHGPTAAGVTSDGPGNWFDPTWFDPNTLMDGPWVSGSDAVFGAVQSISTSSYVVTVNGAVVANSITFNPGPQYTLNATAGNSITLSGDQTVTLNTGAADTIAGSLRGTITAVGFGTLTLGGGTDAINNASLALNVNSPDVTVVLAKASSATVHAVTGSISILDGTVQLGGTGGDQIGPGVPLTINGGTLDLNGRSETVTQLQSDAGASAGQIINTATGTTGRLTVVGGGTFAGSLLDGAGKVALTISSGTEILSGFSNFSGGLTVSGGGKIVIGSVADGFSNIGASTVTLNSGNVDFNGIDATARTWDLNNASGGTIFTKVQSLLTLTGAVLGYAANPGASSLTKTGPGTLTLSGTADNTNAYLNALAGITNLAKTSSATVHALGGISNIAAGATVRITGTGGDQIAGTGVTPSVGGVNLSGGTFDLNGNSEGFDRLTGAAGTVINAKANTTVTLQLGEGGGSGSFAGLVKDGANLGVMALNVVGGSATLTGNNTYSGGSTVTGGTLAAGPNVTGTDPFGTGSITLAGGRLSVQGQSATGTAPLDATQSYLNPLLVTADSSADVSGSLNATLGVTSIGANKLSVTSTSASTAPYALTLNNVTLTAATGSATFDVAASAGGGAGTLNLGAVTPASAGSTAGITKSGAGTANVTGASTYTGPTLVTGGALVVAAPGGTLSAQTAVTNHAQFTVNNSTPVATVDGTGTTTVAAGQTLTTSYVRQGTANINGVVAVRPSATTDAPSGTSVLTSLNIAGSTGAWTGKLDLANNGMVVDYAAAGTSPLATVQDQVKSGYNGGTWTGNGITASSAATPAAKGHLALGFAEASRVLGLTGTNTGTFLGQTVDATAVLFRYTTFGDATLDGQVNFADFVQLSNHFGLPNDTAPGPVSWQDGDFNYDGQVSFADFVLLSNNFGNITPAQSAAVEQFARSAAISSVPEPGSATVIALAAAGLLARRRARKD